MECFIVYAENIFEKLKKKNYVNFKKYLSELFFSEVSAVTPWDLVYTKITEKR